MSALSDSPAGRNFSARLLGPTSRDPAWLYWVLGTLFTLVLAYLDCILGHEIGLDIFYLTAAGLAAWRCGPFPAYYLSVLSAVAYYVSDYLTGYEYGHPLLRAWDCAMLLGFLLVVTALTLRLRAALDRERLLARADPLTGLANRRTFNERAILEVERARRTARPLSVALFDLDDFKQVNDRLGHATGDELLCAVADVMVNGLRQIDLAARLGGDEFAVLLPETDAQGARTCLEDLRKELQATMAQHGWSVGCSIGAVTFTTPSATVEVLLHKADELMYEAKRAGKGQLKHATVGAQNS
jgi:diguanylate cyclase (GGDEF)-like protein